MPFTGKPTYGAGTDLPEIVEDVSDVIGIVSPWETPLLDALGDAKKSAASTVHEWVEDALLPNTDALNQTTFAPDGQTATLLTVFNGGRFQAGDLVRPDGSVEVMQVTSIAGNVLTVVRGYGGTTRVTLTNGKKLFILGNPALEGADANAARYTSRARRQNYTQIFAATVEVSGSMQATRQHGLSDELDYQKQERMRELLRDLENCVINGTAPAAGVQGSATVRRSMNGIVRQLATNVFTPGVAGFPSGGGGGTDLTEVVLNAALRLSWEQSSGQVDTIVVNGMQKRRINAFASTLRSYMPREARYRDLVGVYESDFGVCRIVLSRWCPADMVLLLDSSRIEVLPLRGRSFQYRPMGVTGDAAHGQVLGEYTLEFRNENAHAAIKGLSTT